MNDEQKIEPTELEQAQQKAEEYLNSWKRAQADLINYKKDEAKRVQELIKFGNEQLVLEMIHVIDNLERVLHHIPPNVAQEKDWLKGLEQTVKTFQNLLAKYGVQKIPAQGEKFDPAVHEAISGEGDTVSEEVQAGYTMHGKVIRPARVMLNNNQ